MPYEEFTVKGGRAKFGFPTITLLRSGGLSLNGEAYRILERPDTLVLAFDRDARKIGVRRGKPGERHAYPVRETSGDAYWVAAQGFLRYYAIAVSSTARYAAELDGEYLALDLNKAPVHVEKRMKVRAGTEGGTDA